MKYVERITHPFYKSKWSSEITNIKGNANGNVAAYTDDSSVRATVDTTVVAYADIDGDDATVPANANVESETQTEMQQIKIQKLLLQMQEMKTLTKDMQMQEEMQTLMQEMQMRLQQIQKGVQAQTQT